MPMLLRCKRCGFTDAPYEFDMDGETVACCQCDLEGDMQEFINAYSPLQDTDTGK